MESLAKACPEGVERHVVLVAPEVHWNTGNVGRTCLGAGAFLHLIKPLGFSLAGREVKRAGLDYWPKVQAVGMGQLRRILGGGRPVTGRSGGVR